MSYKQLAAIILLSACVKEVEIEPRLFKKEIVINSLFSQGRLAMSLTATLPFTNGSYPVIDDALVVLAKGEPPQIIDTLKHKHGYVYESNYHVNEYDNYFISVYVPGLGTCSAESHLPVPSEVSEAFYRFPAGYDRYGDPYIEVMLALEDALNVENYYEVFVFHYSQGRASYYTNAFIAENDPVILAEGLEGFKNTSLVFSDRLFDGKNYTLRVKYENASADGPLPDGVFDLEDRALYVVVRSLSKEYYEFRKSWVQHRYHQQNRPAILSADVILTDYVEFLFKGEIQPLYSNVSNGLGVFAGFQQTVMRVNKIE